MITLTSAQLEEVCRAVLSQLAFFTGFIVVLGFVCGFLLYFLTDFLLVVLEPFFYRFVKRFICRRCVNYAVCECSANDCSGFSSKGKGRKQKRMFRLVR